MACAARPDAYYGQPLHTAIRTYLELREHIGPATVKEIHSAMVDGGYQFETASDVNAQRSIRITLTKNSSVFHKLPNGAYGLLSWYPNAKKPKKSEPGSTDAAEAASDEPVESGDEAAPEAEEEEA